MGRFIFYFASQAYYSERRDAFPLKGVTEYGNLVHQYDIPVTWLTNSEGADRGKDIFTEFHEDFGDEVILWGMPSTKGNTSHMRDTVLNLSQDEIESFLRKEQKIVKEILPFARVDHIGWFYRMLPAVRAMQNLGIKSCYGHCWEMIATDGVTDNGVPWGFYYIDTGESWRRPKQRPSPNGIVATEWLQHDLNKSWNHYGSCSIFSFDPNDVERAKICDGRSIGYWKSAFREYYRNLKWNDFIPFVFHQEAHEQESTPGGWEVYDQKTVDNTYAMTDEFLKFITSGEFPKMEIMTLVDAVEEYRKMADSTIPTYMLYKDIPIDMPIWKTRGQAVRNTYAMAKEAEEEAGETLNVETDYQKFKFLGFPYGWQGMIQEKSFPESFVYIDTQCQLFFHKGRSDPVKAWNYMTEIDPSPKNLYFNTQLFQLEIYPKLEEVDDGYVITSASDLPYGFCIWRDVSNGIPDIIIENDISDFAELIETKEIGTTLLFCRLNIGQGKNLIKIDSRGL